MKRKWLFRVTLFVINVLLFMQAAAAVPLSSPMNYAFGAKESADILLNDTERVAVLDMQTQDLLYTCQAEDIFHPVGGVVTLMTALVVWENTQPEDVVNIGDVTSVSKNDVKIGLKQGANHSVLDLTAAMLLYGAKDAALSLAMHVGGSEADFIVLMNAKAKALGMENTTYVNVSGKYDERQNTTALDTLQLANAVANTPQILELLHTVQYNAQSRSLQNKIKNRVTMIDPTSGAYDKRIQGLVIGETQATGFHALLIAQFQGRVLLADVCFDVANDYEQRIRKLLDTAFDEFGPMDLADIANKLAESLEVHVGGEKIPVKAELHADAQGLMGNLEAAQQIGESEFSLVPSGLPDKVKAGEIVCTAALMYRQREIGTVDLIAQIDSVQQETQETVAQVKVLLSHEDKEALGHRSVYDRYGALLWSIAVCAIGAAILLLGRLISRKR